MLKNIGLVIIRLPVTPCTIEALMWCIDLNFQAINCDEGLLGQRSPDGALRGYDGLLVLLSSSLMGLIKRADEC